MSSTPLAGTEEEVFDLTDAVPETERLDSSLQKAKAQLSIKTRRHRPSRSRLRDSLSSTEGDDSFDGKSYGGLLSGACSPLHVSLRCPSPSPSPFPDLHPSSCPAKKDRAFSFETAESEKKEQRPRGVCLLNPSPPTHMLKQDPCQQRQEYHVHMHHRDHVSGGQQCQEDNSPHLEPHHEENSHLYLRDHPQLNQEDQTHLRQRDHTHLGQVDHIQVHHENHQGDHTNLHKREELQEDHTHPHKRDHLQKNQTLMRDKDQVQLHKENPSPLHQREYSQSEDDGHDIGSDEPSSPTVLLDKKTRRRFLDLGVTLRRTYGKVRRERASRHSAENREADGVQSRSSRSTGPPFVPFSWLTDRIRGSGSPKNPEQSPAKSLTEEDEELKNDSSRSTRNESSQPYQSLSDHSDEGRDGRAEDRVVKKKTILAFSSVGRHKAEKQNGVQRDRRDSGHDGDDQKLLTSQSQCKNLDL